MNKNNIFIETLYEFKCTRRNILFGIFAVLVIFGPVIYQFTPLSGIGRVSSIDDLFHFSLDWVSQALPSSIAYKTAYYFNLIQLFFVVGFVANDSRAARLRSLEVLHARPQGNGEIVIGHFLGKFLVFSLVNLLAFAVSILINILFYPCSFEWSVYLFYWVTLTLPTLVYFLGISYLVTRLARHQGLSVMILFAFLGGLVYWGAGWLNGLFDPCARYIPNMFSDFTGHVNLGNYLLQRGFILLAGVGLLALSVIPYPRIPNDLFTLKKNLGVACVVFFLAGGLALVYHGRHQASSDNREAYQQVYGEHGKLSSVRVVRNDLRVKELENGDISVTSRMTVTNRASTTVPFVIYLNPGLKVNTFEIDGQAAPFRRDRQALLVDRELKPGEVVEVSIDYEGGIENDICFLDTAPENYDSPAVNTIGMYRFGYSPAFCERGYKLLTPECIWYPACVPPYGEVGIRDENFTRYSLRVEHDPRLMVISQGNTIVESEGVTVFSFDHDMPGISLCVGDYKKREIVVDSTHLAFYYLSGHEYLLEEYDFPREKLAEGLTRLKEMDFEDDECVRTSEFNQKMYRGEKNAYDPIQQYPYRWFILLEVPCNFYCFPGLMRLTGERVQGGIAFLPEKAYSIKKYPVRMPLEVMASDEENRVSFMLNMEVKMIVGEGNCNIKPLFSGKTTFFSSREYPILHDVFIQVARGIFRTGITSPVDDYLAVKYLNGNSLKDALVDRSLSPEVLERIIRKKSRELHAYISLWVGEERFRQFYIDFLKGNLFKETTVDEFYRQFHQVFDFRLDSLVEGWYTSDQLPLLEVQEARVIKITETDVPYKFYRFKVFNRSDVPCLFKTGDSRGWIIPPHEGREIRACDKVQDLKFMSKSSMEILLAQNLPDVIDLKLEEQGYVPVDTTTGVFCVDSSTFLPNGEEIIVDNEDPGFRMVKAKGFIGSLFREEKSRKEYRSFSVRDTWVPTIGQQFHGFPVRSAFKKFADSGKQKVEWNASLPREGKYEVFFYYAESLSGGISTGPNVEYSCYYTVFDGREEHEVVATLNKDEAGDWVSLGVFDFSKNAKVTLSDRGGTGSDVQMLVADAVKWVPVKE